MSKDRWIVPIQSTGRIEISIVQNNQVRVELYDSKNEKAGEKGTIDLEELEKFIHDLQKAGQILINRGTMKGDGVCCDPGNGSRPVEGCHCFCCVQARQLRNPPDADEVEDTVDVITRIGGGAERLPVPRPRK